MYHQFVQVLGLKILLLFLLTGCSDGDSAQAEGTENNGYEEPHEQRDQLWNSLEEAQGKASENDKWVLIDIYTEWCAYCRQMYNETYTNQRVIDKLNEYFYVTRVDAESDEMVKFNGEELSMERLAAEFGVTSYPTTVIVKPDGEPFAIQPGYIEADQFTGILTYVGTDAYEDVSFDEYMEEFDDQ